MAVQLLAAAAIVRIQNIDQIAPKKVQHPKLKRRKAPAMSEVKLQFEAGDIVEEVMSFGSPTPIEVSVNGPSLDDNIAGDDLSRRRIERNLPGREQKAVGNDALRVRTNGRRCFVGLNRR